MNSAVDFKCPACGGKVTFDIKSQTMICPYCGTQVSVATVIAYNKLLNMGNTQETHWESLPSKDTWGEGEEEELVSYVCEACGGEIVCDENTAASKCPYCDSDVVLKGNVTGSYRPDGIIPFRYDKVAAKAALIKHFQGKRLLPKIFIDKHNIDEIKGIYVPYWLLDAETEGYIKCKGERVIGVSEREGHEDNVTAPYVLLRSGKAFFEKIPIVASANISVPLLESLEPYNYIDIRKFEMPYLSGYMAERYSVGANDMETAMRLNGRVTSSMIRTLIDMIYGYEGISVDESEIRIKKGKIRYMLFPVWILNTTWNNERYVFAMNGNTGKFVGDLPMDKKLYVKSIIRSTLITTIVVLLLFFIFRLF